MNNIGLKIKELRKKNGFTQEKLAEALGVTFQSVSKWETNSTVPDISMIVPLAQLFNVSTDELLGMQSTKEKIKKQKYNEAYIKYKESLDHGASYWWAKEAVFEYPNNFYYVEWLANAEYQLAFDENCSSDGSVEYLDELINNALRRYESIIETCNDTELVRQAVIGKIISLMFIGRTEEAEWSAEFEYPDITIKTVNDVLNLNVRGRELIKLIESEK